MNMRKNVRVFTFSIISVIVTNRRSRDFCVNLNIVQFNVQNKTKNKEIIIINNK